jgi:DNA polymerase III subunit epsilon
LKLLIIWPIPKRLIQINCLPLLILPLLLMTSTQGQASLLSTELLAFYRGLGESQLTVVDVETTGSVAYKERVIEVSILKATLADGILEQQTHLINPLVKIPPIITKITGITPAMVGSAAFPEDVWSLCADDLNQGVLTAHNLEFDYSFLQAEYKHMGSSFSRPASHRFCTVMLSRLMLADLPSRSLPDLVRHFNLNVGPSHRAEADTKACWFVAEMLLKRIQQEPDETLLPLFQQQWIRLRDAAAILKCRKSEASELLDNADIEYRFSKRSNQMLYRRGDVEAVYWSTQGEQLSML